MENEKKLNVKVMTRLCSIAWSLDSSKVKNKLFHLMNSILIALTESEKQNVDIRFTKGDYGVGCRYST